MKEKSCNQSTTSLCEQTKAAYKRIAHEYADSRPTLPERSKAMLDKLVQWVEKVDATAVDIGAGHGLELEYLLKTSGIRGIAIEPDAELRGRIPQAIERISADARDIPLANSCASLVLCHAVLHHFPLETGGVRAAVAQASRLLKDKGIYSVLIRQTHRYVEKDGRFFEDIPSESLQGICADNGLKLLESQNVVYERAKPAWREWLWMVFEKKKP